MQTSLRNNRLRFETSGRLLLIDEPDKSEDNWLRLETLRTLLITDEPDESDEKQPVGSSRLQKKLPNTSEEIEDSDDSIHLHAGRMEATFRPRMQMNDWACIQPRTGCSPIESVPKERDLSEVMSWDQAGKSRAKQSQEALKRKAVRKQMKGSGVASYLSI